ncbi:pyrrolidone-carboxylate peptidase [Azospirillum picis]|uniref:Pyrrolidone-carboxylate peptidase n=1 Tax=Azospirillum picis TaxID=488438 RepID=A0ABU0MDF8_9PROT|nr:pyrrolidone-carboxylate peptidase [Azospirillum picis]MDQ0531461.1 pyrrolidone-carboxylate peptidase [Azospirillum picis]
MTRAILLAGVEPFGGENVNPSWEAARHPGTPSMAVSR